MVHERWEEMLPTEMAYPETDVVVPVEEWERIQRVITQARQARVEVWAACGAYNPELCTDDGCAPYVRRRLRCPECPAEMLAELPEALAVLDGRGRGSAYPANAAEAVEDGSGDAGGG